MSEVAEALAGGHFVVVLDEAEYIAAGAADEAVEDLLVRDNGQGGRALAVEGAEALELAAGFFERDVLRSSARISSSSGSYS